MAMSGWFFCSTSSFSSVPIHPVGGRARKTDLHEHGSRGEVFCLDGVRSQLRRVRWKLKCVMMLYYA